MELAVAREWHPGMKMYEAVWKRDDVEIFHAISHANDEADMIAVGLEIFAYLVERGQTEGDLEGTTVEVRICSYDRSQRDIQDA